MNEETVRAWIVKAEEDLKIGQDELATEFPAWSGVAFHMQQCAEKYLKAYLTFHNRAFRKTHDISELLQICIEVDESFTRLQEANVDELTLYAVAVRYPSDFPTPTQQEVQRAHHLALTVRQFVRDRLQAEGMMLPPDGSVGR